MDEEMNHKDKTDRFKGGGLETLGSGPGGNSDPEARNSTASKWPPSSSLRRRSSSRIWTPLSPSTSCLTGPIFPFDVRTDFVKVTEGMDLVPITLQIKNRDITFVTKDGVSKGVVNILGKVTTITGKTVQTFEDTVEVDQPAELLEKSLDSNRSTGRRCR
jgi:hypothetical protein